MKRTQKTQAALDLTRESFGQYPSSFTREELLADGCLINVTAWVHREMDFGVGESRFRVHAAVTAKLWRTLQMIPPAVRFFQTVRGRGHDVLWLAGWALEKARRIGLDCVYFQAVLPTGGDEEDCKTLRVEYGAGDDGRPWITIGFPEEFPLV